MAAMHAIRSFPNAAFALVIVTVLACGVGIANMPSSQAATAQAPPSGRDPSAQAPGSSAAASADEAAAHTMARQPRWGIVESINALPTVTDRPDEFDFTVRWRDRSVQVTRSVGRAQWLVGDRIMLMGGPRLPAN